jgi:hypothetical protein
MFKMAEGALREGAGAAHKMAESKPGEASGVWGKERKAAGD